MIDPGHSIAFSLNGRPVRMQVEARHSLAEALLDRHGLCSLRIGCDEGVCGTCTVLVDGKPLRACLMLAVQAAGTDIRTAEGLATGGARPNPDRLPRIKAAFRRHGALQCGYCTPGFLMLVTHILEAKLSRDEARRALAGNLCRCTGYEPILTALDDLLKESAPDHGGAPA